MKKALRTYRAWSADSRTLHILQSTHSVPYAAVKRWRNRITEQSPAITLGGIVELCEQGASVTVEDEVLVVRHGSFTGRAALSQWPEPYKVIDILLPWIHCT